MMLESTSWTFAMKDVKAETRPNFYRHNLALTPSSIFAREMFLNAPFAFSWVEANMRQQPVDRKNWNKAHKANDASSW